MVPLFMALVTVCMAFPLHRCVPSLVWIGAVMVMVYVPKVYSPVTQAWFMWITYSLIFKECVSSSLLLVLFGSLWNVSLGTYSLYSVWQKSEPLPSVLYTGLFLVPGGHNVLFCWSPWDILLHVAVFLMTFYFQKYASCFLKRETTEHSQVTSTAWILMVTKWCVPFIGLYWMYLAYEMSNVFSRRIQSPRSTPSPPEDVPAVVTPVATRPPPRPTRTFKPFRRSLLGNQGVMSLVERSKDIGVV